MIFRVSAVIVEFRIDGSKRYPDLSFKCTHFHADSIEIKEKIRFLFEFKLNNGRIVNLIEKMLDTRIHRMRKMNFKKKLLV
jgi:hypothetical protein